MILFFSTEAAILEDGEGEFGWIEKKAMYTTEKSAIEIVSNSTVPTISVTANFALIFFELFLFNNILTHPSTLYSLFANI